MASLCFLVLIIMASLVSLCCCSTDHHHPLMKLLDIPIPSTHSSSSSSPAPAPAPTVVFPSAESPSTELSPDVSPLLPSSGGVVPSPTSSSSSLPTTIPSNPSPPKPGDGVSVGPDSAFAPFGSASSSTLQPAASSSAFKNLTPTESSRIVVKFFTSFMTYYSAVVFALAL